MYAGFFKIKSIWGGEKKKRGLKATDVNAFRIIILS